MKSFLMLTSLLLLVNPANLHAVEPSDPLSWGNHLDTCGPWTRWWWLGSAVDKPNLTRQLEQFKSAGIDGVEICPIYGAKGYEDRYIDFLSAKWIEMVRHTADEGRRLGVGVDITTGTGWPFGGSSISRQDASSKVVLKRYDAAGGAIFRQTLPDGQVQSLVAISDAGATVDLKDRVTGQSVEWTAPAGKWRIYAVLDFGPVQKVKRAAPGGEGNVVDPFSVSALSWYLRRFDPLPAYARAQFHDSYEYNSASWTPDFFRQFQVRRHYDLRTHLPSFFGDADDDQVARVKYDYRQTIAELHLAYVQTWSDWVRRHGQQSREQAHGAPANLLDLYAAANIPESELQFGDVNERQIPMLKFASSAAHLTRKPLSSSESFTWLGEHFQVSLADVKPAADLFFLSGVNHIFFHGIPYSPEDVQWPGWLFYAAVNFGPNGGLWHDLPAFNAYVARCQSVLREGLPDNDVLLYFPIHDIWETPNGMLIPMGVGDQNKWLWNQSAYKTATGLWKSGVGFDFVSDAQIRSGRSDQIVVVPTCKYMPANTAIDLVGFAKDGGTVVFEGALPEDVPGLGELEQQRARLHAALAEIGEARDGNASKLGKGRVFVGGNLLRALEEAGARRERMTDMGLRFIRRKNETRWSYFVVNSSDRAVDAWVPLGSEGESVAILDPRFESRSGFGAVRKGKDGLPEVYLQMLPGESRILRTVEAKWGGREWVYSKADGEPQPITGQWQIEFIEGGPKLPEAIHAPRLASWTTLGGADARIFAGTARYSIEFDRPSTPADDWTLKLGKVCQSARVSLNGQELGTLWCAPFEISLGKSLREGRNKLEIEVTNLAANRIADLDRHHVDWKSFHEINFVNRNYKPFDASTWPLRDSGLIGPVELIPTKNVRP